MLAARQCCDRRRKSSNWPTLTAYSVATTLRRSETRRAVENACDVSPVRPLNAMLRLRSTCDRLITLARERSRMTRRTTNELRSPRDCAACRRRRAVLRMQRTDSAAAESRSADRSAADAGREVRLGVHASVRHELCEDRSRLARHGTGRHRLRSAADAAARRAAGRNETPRSGESERGARIRQHVDGAGPRRSCDPAFKKAIDSTSKSACPARAKRRASATAGCSRRD